MLGFPAVTAAEKACKRIFTACPLIVCFALFRVILSQNFAKNFCSCRCGTDGFSYGQPTKALRVARIERVRGSFLFVKTSLNVLKKSKKKGSIIIA